jgi:hypothetical protein
MSSPDVAPRTWAADDLHLQAALRRIIAGLKPPPPYATQIPAIARELLLMRPNPTKPQMPVREGLERVAKAAGQLCSLLDQLPPAAITALNLRKQALMTFKTTARTLTLVAGGSSISSVAGAPEKKHARKVAETVGIHYCRLTGKKPTVPKKGGVPYGPFLTLLKRVYKVLGIKASAASQAEAVCRNWRAISRLV